MLNSLKLLVSPVDEQEALETILGGADIVDVKNPKEGALGANFPWIIKRIRAITPKNIEVSCTIGDLPNLPGSVSLAALGAATTGVNYVKASLYGIRTKEDAINLMQNVVKSVKDYNNSIKVVVAGYADANRIGSINPLLVPEIAYKSGCDVAMIDTAVKDGKSLFDFLDLASLNVFINESHNFGLKAALAGSLKRINLSSICRLNADIIGLRGAACTNDDRLNGCIKREAVQEIKQIIKKASYLKSK